MSLYRPDHYYLFDEMTAFLKALVKEHAPLAALESIGKSGEGRDIWLVTLTDPATGRPEEKPAYWIDGNTHASEVMGSAVCLYTLNYLLQNKDDPEVAPLLRCWTFYVVPRINPDGAEYCLTKDAFIRSVPRFYPEEQAPPGLVAEDIDESGEILQMRVEAVDGAWKKSKKDARLLVPRRPWDSDEEGPFYHLYREGLFHPEVADDPGRPVNPNPHGLDFNRNYPYHWRPEHQEKGAGPFPLSEPETRAVAEFLTTHRNVFGCLSYHTFSGVLLRPFSDRPDEAMPRFDLEVYNALGKRCEEHTGFPVRSTYHDFCYDKTNLTTGAFDDWAYDHLGVHAFTMELWCPWKHAGLDFSDDFLRFGRARTEEEDLAMLRWNDEALNGEGFVDWRPFEHSQLGSVEIGGWRWMYSWRNAPPHLLEKECRESCLFSLDHARSGPMPRLTLEVEAVAEGLFQVTAVMENRGFLPTYVTEHARRQGMARKLHLSIEAAPDQELLQGPATLRVDHLSGYANATIPHRSAFTFDGESRAHVARQQWLVRGTGDVTVCWWGDRIGKLSQKATLSRA